MSFRFTPGCCCGSEEQGPCKPPCQKLFEGFYNIIWYERDSNQPLLYSSYPARCKDTGFVIAENAYNDGGSASGCVEFGIAYELKNGTYRFYADPNAQVKNGNARLYVQLVSALAEYGSNNANYYRRTAEWKTSDPESFDPTAYYSLVRKYTYDNLYHGTFDYYIVHAVPFNFTAEPIRFQKGTNNRLQRVELSAVPLLDPTGTPTANTSDMHLNKTVAQYFVTPESCGVRPLDSCDYRVLQSYAGLIPANRVRSFFDSCASGLTSGQPVPPTTYFYLRLWGVNRSWAPIVETVGVTFARRGGAIHPIVKKGRYSMQTCQLDNSTFKTYYNQYRASGAVDYPDGLLEFSGTTAGQIKASSLMFGTGNDGALDNLDSVGTANSVPARWENTSDPLNDNAQRFRGIYWLFGEVCPCDGEFQNEVTSGTLFTLVGKCSLNTGNLTPCGYMSSDGWRQFAKSRMLNLTPSQSILYEERMREVGGAFNSESYNDFGDMLSGYYFYTESGQQIHYLGAVPFREGKRLTHLLWCIGQPGTSARNAVNRDPTSVADLTPCTIDLEFIIIAKPASIAFLTSKGYQLREYLNRDKYYKFYPYLSAVDSYSSPGSYQERSIGPNMSDSLLAQFKTQYNLEQREDRVIGTDYRVEADGYFPTLNTQKLNRYLGLSGGGGTRDYVTNIEDSYGRTPSHPMYQPLSVLEWADSGTCECYLATTIKYIAFWEDE